MLTKYEHKLAINTIRRKKIFLVLSIISVIIGLGLAVFYSWEAYIQPRSTIGIHFVLVVLILLNARQYLRQHNYAKILETVISSKSVATNQT